MCTSIDRSQKTIVFMGWGGGVSSDYKHVLNVYLLLIVPAYIFLKSRFQCPASLDDTNSIWTNKIIRLNLQ